MFAAKYFLNFSESSTNLGRQTPPNPTPFFIFVCGVVLAANLIISKNINLKMYLRDRKVSFLCPETKTMLQTFFTCVIVRHPYQFFFSIFRQLET